MGTAYLPGVEGGDVIISCEWEFLLASANHADDMVALGDQVMDCLMDLEAVDERLRDSSVSLDAAGRSMTIGLAVQAANYEDGVAHALTSIRTAIHAAGGATPEWGESGAHLEPAGFRAAAV